MCKAPFTTVLMAALLGAAPLAFAHEAMAASAIPPAVAAPAKPALRERMGTAVAAQSNAVLVTEKTPVVSQMVASANQETDRMTPVRASPPESLAPGKDSDWRYAAAWLGTLAIIATIAVRRRKVGRPWA